MFAAALLFLKGVDWRVYAAMAAVAGVLWYGHSQRLKERAEWEAKVEQADQAARAQEERAKDATQQVQEVLREQQLVVRTETQTLTNEVPVYVTSNADRACIVPAGFVQHHDAAARLSGLPAAAGGLVDAPSGIPLSRVESVVSSNYGTAHELAAEVRAWREWYRRQAEIAARTTP